MSERIKKLNAHLRDEAAQILQSQLRVEEGILVTVTRAEVSPTLEHANIYITVFPKTQAAVVFKKIKEQIFFIQQELNQRLVMRPVPKIRFASDDTEEHASRIEEILQKSQK